MKDPKRFDLILRNAEGRIGIFPVDDGEWVAYDDYEKLKSRLASVEAILKVCFSKEPLKITHYTKNRND